MIRSPKVVRLRFAVIRDKVDSVLVSLGQLGLVHFIDIKKTSNKELLAMIKPYELSSEAYGISEIHSKVSRLINKVGLQPRKVITTDLNLKNQFNKIEEAIKSIESMLSDQHTPKDLMQKYIDHLLNYEAALRALREVENVKAMYGGVVGRMFVFDCWVPKEKLSIVTETIDKYSDQLSIYEVIEDLEEIEEKPPTVIDEKSKLGGFAALTRGFGIPVYGEIDPSIFMMITFPIFFGIMFGDVGHGLIFFIASLYIMHIKRKKISIPDIFRPIVQGADILIICAVFSIFFGFLYGEFLGSNEWFKALTNINGKPIYSILGLSGLEEEVAEHRWFIILMKLCIYIGMLHIIFGLVLDIINKITEKEYKHMFSGPVLWLWFYGTLTVLFTLYDFNPTTRVSQLLSDVFSAKNPSFLPVSPLYLLIVPAITMFTVRIFIEGFTEALGESLEHLIASISNTISYLRIFAFHLVHWAISQIGLMGKGSIYIYLSLPLATFLIMTLELLATFMQALRLHWVEWFLKFYKGEGYIFKPFQL
ncbi:MAG: V-type ATPase 116kDa subunit family protein [Candidatus Methanomethylicia archaeon]